jgi:hypothetical protein
MKREKKEGWEGGRRDKGQEKNHGGGEKKNQTPDREEKNRQHQPKHQQGSR